ncbi:MAG: ABC transporter permease [Simkaniaceae bacterium]|nr:ABC transporter permease [Simkaniaceae bacterium]
MNDVDTLFTTIARASYEDEDEETQPTHSYWKDSFTSLKNNRVAIAALIFLILLILAATLIPYFHPTQYFETNLKMKNQPPSFKHWFGTDELGRSIFIRIWWGARISLLIGVTAAAIDVIIGVFYGAFAGYVGGRVEDWMMRLADVFYSLPRLVIVILLMVVLGQGITTIIIAMTLTGWINMARIIRGQVVQLKQSEYIAAAKVIGASESRVLLYHLIPNTIGSIITTMTLTIPAAIFTEAFLSFLGLGVQAPLASWGTMANDGLSALRFYPWRLFLPAGFISITMLAFNLLGDGLRDSFDPRLR